MQPKQSSPCPPPPPIFRAKLKSLPLVPHSAVSSAREYISSDLKAQLSASFKLDHQKLDIYLKQRALIFWTDAIKLLAAGKSSTCSCSFALKPCWLTFRGVSLYRKAQVRCKMFQNCVTLDNVAIRLTTESKGSLFKSHKCTFIIFSLSKEFIFTNCFYDSLPKEKF